MSVPDSSEPLGPAEALFAEHLARRTDGRSTDLEEVCGAHPEHADALRRIAAAWEHFRSICRIDVNSTAARLRLSDELQSRFGSNVDPGVSIAGEPPAAEVGDSSALLERLRAHAPLNPRYRLLGEVGRGGMGAVLRIWDEDLRRTLAMKVVLGKEDAVRAPTLDAAPTPPVDPKTLGRFLEEAQVTGQLDHPGIVPVHELGLDANGHVYFTMRLVKGEELRAIFERAASGSDDWNQTRILSVLLKVCEAMSYAHDKGVVHRDLKPANVMVGRYGEVYVMDWGLARVIGQKDLHDVRPRPASETSGSIRTERRSHREETPDSPLVTMDGDIVGTPAYMSPEQARGDLNAMGPHSDVYALGAMLYHLLAGHMPYVPPGARANVYAVWQRVQEGPPQPLALAAPHAPAELVAICQRAMEREIGLRYRDMRELADDLRAFLEQRVVRAYESGTWAETKKWVRRNRVLAASLATTLVFAVIATISLTVLVRQVTRTAREANTARNEAVEQGRRATEEAQRNRLLADENAALAIDLRRSAADLAALRRQLGDLAGALALDEQLLASGERLLPADHPDLLTAKQNLALTRKELGDLEAAYTLEQQVHAARERLLPAEHPDLLAAKQNLAVTLQALGDLDGALALEEQVHATRERLLPAEHPDLLAAKQNLAVTREALGDLEGALALNEYVHAVRERVLPSDHRDLLEAQARLGSTRYALGDLEGAQALFEHVHAVRERMLPPDHRDTLMAKTLLASTRKALGDLEGALALEDHVHATLERLMPTDHPNLLAAKASLGATLLVLGDFARAEIMFEQVHAARERLLPADHPDLLAAKSDLAVTRGALGDLVAALGLLTEVHAARERVLPADHPDVLESKSNLGLAYRALGDLEGALTLLEQVRASRDRLLPADHPFLLDAEGDLAVTRRMLGDFVGARVLDEHVHSARERLLPSYHPDLLTAKQSLAATLHELGDLEGVRALSATALAAQIALCATLTTFAPRHARSAALRELDRLEWHAFYDEWLQRNGLKGLALELLESLESLRLVSSGTLSVARNAARVPELRSMQVQLARVQRDLADMSRAAPVENLAIIEWRAQLIALAEKRDRLQRDMRLRLGALGLGTDLPDVSSIAAGIEEGGVYVGFWRYDRYQERSPGSAAHEALDSLLAFVVERDGNVTRVELGPAESIEQLVSQWRDALGAPLDMGIRAIGSRDPGDAELAAGRSLRAALLDPVLAALGEQAPRVLHVVPDDFVQLVPLDALPNDDGSRLGERIDVRIDSSVARLIRPRRVVEAKGTLVAFGGIDYGDEALAPLPGTLVEARAAATLFVEHVGDAPRLVTGKEASEARLFEVAPEARYLHIATHGWFVPESAAVSMLDQRGEHATVPLRSSVARAQETIVGFLPETLCGLALAGANNGPEGILTAEELSTLDLTNCELAVLSASESSVGIRRAGQGILSLQTALHAAGARTAITSLWRVDDVATSRLFELFYTKLWSEKLGPADALWQAKMALRAEGHSTRDWAGWVLTGDPD